MREFRTAPIVKGDHFLLDGEEYVAEKANGRDCESCALCNSHRCYLLPCDNVIFKRVEKEHSYRPYKDTEEMIADWKERFMVDEIPDFCMPLIWVKSGVICSLITDILPKGVVLYGDAQNMNYLFDSYTYLDGSPCGKEIE